MININLDKAKEIHKTHLRTARTPLLSALDVQFQRTLETGGDTKDIVAKKQELRDITKLPDTIKSVDDLKAHWDETLLESSSPYTNRN
jgi:hypothetical protein